MHVPRLPSRPSETESLRVGPRYLNVEGKKAQISRESDNHHRTGSVSIDYDNLWTGGEDAHPQISSFGILPL